MTERPVRRMLVAPAVLTVGLVATGCTSVPPSPSESVPAGTAAPAEAAPATLEHPSS